VAPHAAAGRIVLTVLRPLKPFDMHLHYCDRHRLPEAVEKELNLTWHPNVEDMVKVCDDIALQIVASGSSASVPQCLGALPA